MYIIGTFIVMLAAILMGFAAFAKVEALDQDFERF